MFKKQLSEIDKAVLNTAVKLNRIQETLDKVLENLKLGKSIELTTNENDPKIDLETVENDSFGSEMRNTHEIYDRTKLLELLKSIEVDKLKDPPRLNVGMIGYPNVGKSSTVNILMQTKKVR